MPRFATAAAPLVSFFYALPGLPAAEAVARPKRADVAV